MYSSKFAFNLIMLLIDIMSYTHIYFTILLKDVSVLENN
jgi:hypothetical protein